MVGLRAAAKETPSIDTAPSWPRAALKGVLIEDVAPEHLKPRRRLQCGGVAREGANGMPSSQRLRYELAPLRAGGADDEDFHYTQPGPPHKVPTACLWT